MTYLLRTFNIKYAFQSGLLIFSLYVALEVLMSVLLRAANSFLVGVVDVGTGVVVLNGIGFLGGIFLIITPPIFYFSKSQASFRDGILLSLVLICSASLSEWAINLYRTLSDDNGIVYGGDIGVMGALLILVSSTIVAMSALYFKR